MSSSNQRVTRSQSRGDSAQSAVEPSREEKKLDEVMSNTDKYASTDESCDSEPTTVKYVLL